MDFVLYSGLCRSAEKYPAGFVLGVADGAQRHCSAGRQYPCKPYFCIGCKEILPAHCAHDLFKKISYLSSAQIDYFSIPSLEARLTTDSYNINQVIGMMQRLGIRAPILLIGGIAITMTLEPVLTWTMISVLPFIALVVWLVSRKGIPMYTDLQRGVDIMVRTVRENISGIRVIKALSKTEQEKEHFSQVNRDVVRCETKASVTMGITNPMMNLFLNVGLTLVIVVGAFRINAGKTQPGTIIAFCLTLPLF